MFVHLHCHSPFSLLDGADSVEALVAQAAMYGMPAIALTDHDTIAGLPTFHRWAATYGIKPISGAEITLEDGSHVTLLAQTRVGYRHLCEVLTSAYSGPGDRLSPRVREETLLACGQGLIVLSGCRRGPVARRILRRDYQGARAWADRYRTVFPDAFYLEMQADGYPQSDWLNRQLAELGEELNIPLVATSNVHYVDPHHFPVHDILRCVRAHCDIRTPHPDRPLNQSRWLHDADEAQRRFAAYPSAIANTLAIAERCEVVLQLHQPQFPAYPLPPGEADAAAYLRRLVYQGAADRYPHVDAALKERLEHELAIISSLGYVDYFLVVWDIVHYARRRRIRCAGRGSAADSAVAYCLYITDVDAAGRGLLFERFMSLERAEKPDIDVDFDSARRDEVIDYVYQKYGRDHVARVATYQTFRGRSAIREIGAALGLPATLIDTLAKRVPWMAHADDLPALFERVPELKPFAAYRNELPWLWQLAARVAGFPRHFGMHVGGVIVSKQPLYEITSLQPSAKGEWMTPFDKDGVEDVGLIKLDLLSLRTMAAIEGTVVLSERQGRTLDYDRLPFDDPDTFEMIRSGETIGVFQLESPAQRALQARLGADRLEDIVASVALIRPGPIQGNMVDPFLQRRRGLESISYLHPKLEPILGKTYGVVLFQEQVIEIATAIANFTPGEADQLRRVMSHARSKQDMAAIGQQFIDKATAAGVDPNVASTIFSYMQGYASYGFCEAHAAAFAATAYKTAYLVRHYPAEFYASILNQHPMGYYPIHVICAEARRRGIQILGVDVNDSEWLCTVPEPLQIRLGFRLVKGCTQDAAIALVKERDRGGHYRSAADVIVRVPALDRLTAERLVRVGALDRVAGLDRRALLWQIPEWFAQRESPASELFVQALSPAAEPPVGLPTQSLAAKLEDEYNLLGVGISGHWMEVVRPALRTGVQPITAVLDAPEDARVTVAGLAVRPHRPPTKSGRTVVFFTLEDETGTLDATMFESVYRSSGAVLFTPYGRLIGVEGTIQRRSGARAQLLVSRVWPIGSAGDSSWATETEVYEQQSV